MTTLATAAICPVFRYQDGPAAIDWLVRAFGFETHTDYRTPTGAVAHADLRFGPSVIGVSSAITSLPDSPWAGIRQGIYVRVDNPDAYHDRAKSAGAEIVMPLRDMDYGSREFSLRDVGGYLWGFGTYDMGAKTGEPSIWPELRYPNAARAVTWLEQALGFVRTMAVSASARAGSQASSGETSSGPARGPDETGALMHAELRLGRAVLMLGPELPGTEWADARQVVHLRVDDPDAHFVSAKAAGATIIREPQTAPYGARFYAVRDPERFVWWVSNYKPA